MDIGKYIATISMHLEYALMNDSSWQNQADWQTPDTPFMSFAFWQALADTGAIGEQAGWLPIFILVYRVIDDSTVEAANNENDNVAQTTTQAIAVLPVFIKGHHRGEFVFDHTWAEAYARYGMDYYPRLVTSVPYTPITGQRFWLATGETLNESIIKTAIAGIDDIAQQVGASSWHGLFVTPELAAVATAAMPTDIDVTLAIAAQNNAIESALIDLPILERQGCQFLWQNRDLLKDGQPFADFDGFLMTLKAKKRKTIRAERRKVAEQGITCQRKCGDDITDEDWKAFYHCYVMTYAVRGQQPYLTMGFLWHWRKACLPISCSRKRWMAMVILSPTACSYTILLISYTILLIVKARLYTVVIGARLASTIACILSCAIIKALSLPSRKV